MFCFLVRVITKCFLVRKMASTIIEMRDFEKFVLRKYELRLEWAGKTTILLVDRKGDIKYEFGLQPGTKTKVTSRVADKSADVSRFMQLVRFHISQRDPNRIVRATDVVTHKENQCQRNKCFSHFMRAFPDEWIEFNGGSSIATTPPNTSISATTPPNMPISEPATTTMLLKFMEKMIDDNARISVEQEERRERQQFYESEKNAILQMLATKFKGVDLDTYKESLQHLRELARYILDGNERRSLSHADIVKELLDRIRFGIPPYPEPAAAPKITVERSPITIEVPDYNIKRIPTPLEVPQLVPRPVSVDAPFDVPRPVPQPVNVPLQVPRPVSVDAPFDVPRPVPQPVNVPLQVPRPVSVDAPFDVPRPVPQPFDAPFNVPVPRPVPEPVDVPQVPQPQPSIQCRTVESFGRGEYPATNPASVIISNVPNTNFTIRFHKQTGEVVQSVDGTTASVDNNVDIKGNLNALDPGIYTIRVQILDLTKECRIEVIAPHVPPIPPTPTPIPPTPSPTTSTGFTFITLDSDNNVTIINKYNNLDQIKKYCEKVKDLINRFVGWLKTDEAATDFVKIFLTFKRYNATFADDDQPSIYANQNDLHIGVFDSTWLSNTSHAQALRAYLQQMGYDINLREVETFISQRTEQPPPQRLNALRTFLQSRERDLEKIYERLPKTLTQIKNQLCNEVDSALCGSPTYVLLMTYSLNYIEMVQNTTSMYMQLTNRPGLDFDEIDPITSDLVDDDFNWISFVDAYTRLNRYIREHEEESRELDSPKIYVSIPSVGDSDLDDVDG